MQYQDANPSQAAEDFSEVPVPSWERFELDREIALLEGVVARDRVDAVTDTLLAERARLDLYESEEDQKAFAAAAEQRVVVYDIEEELRNSYLQYAMSVIVERALPDVREDLTQLRGACERLKASYGASFYLGAIHRVGATVLRKLVAVLEACAAEALKLKAIATIAFLRVPLFSYGPELSWFRHRLRLSLA